MGPLLRYYLNLFRALQRTLEACFRPEVLPKRLDQLLFALCGGDYRITISRWSRHNRDKLYARPIVWLTHWADEDHIDEIDDTRPYHEGPGFGWALLGNTLLVLVVLWVF